MERDFGRELRNFNEVWQRVEKGGKMPEQGIKLMPGKKKNKGPGRPPSPGKKY